MQRTNCPDAHGRPKQRLPCGTRIDWKHVIHLIKDSHVEHKLVVEQDAGVVLARHPPQADFAHPKVALHLVLDQTVKN